ncbi:uncharacterized protein PSFLO_01615 [Pseudozyma flocculosa]|uniref:Uncharacterized protein n=1 Tax=Pseudozyma flocculosa TaxID=84751 RepID=A0A5C3EV07_9BASI|nr:uncharacterized protein PSFLO_01615 [Pseudozyma flocculosa]
MLLLLCRLSPLQQQQARETGGERHLSGNEPPASKQASQWGEPRDGASRQTSFAAATSQSRAARTQPALQPGPPCPPCLPASFAERGSTTTTVSGDGGDDDDDCDDPCLLDRPSRALLSACSSRSGERSRQPSKQASWCRQAGQLHPPSQLHRSHRIGPRPRPSKERIGHALRCLPSRRPEQRRPSDGVDSLGSNGHF